MKTHSRILRGYNNNRFGNRSEERDTAPDENKQNKNRESTFSKPSLYSLPIVHRSRRKSTEESHFSIDEAFEKAEKTMQLTRTQVKILLETSTTVEEADEIINKNYNFESIREKVAFLKGMFDVQLIGHEEKEPDEMDYFSILATIINHAEK